MPNLQFPPYALIVLISAFTALGLGVYGLKRRKDKVFLYFGISFIILSMWPLIYGIQLIIADREYIETLARLSSIPMQFFPIFLLCCIFQLVKQKLPPKWFLILLFSISSVVSLAMFSNDQHHLIWDKTLFVTTKEGFNLILLTPSVWKKFITILFHDGIDLIVLYMLIKAVIVHKQPYKTQFQLIIVAILIVIIVTLLYIFKLFPFEPYNPIPATFAFSSILVAIAIFKYRLLNVIPYARESVFDIIDSPVIISDNNNIVVDYNAPARKVLRLSNDIIGLPIKKVFELLRIDWTELEESEPTTIHTKWGTGANYQLSVLKKRVQQGDIEGSLVIFNDITAQMDAITTAHEKEILTYKESILGDMHDGIGGVVATGTILAQMALDEEDVAVKNKKIAQIASLLENGSFELRSMLNILDKKDIDWSSLVADMRGFSATVLESRDIERKFSINGKIYNSYVGFDTYISIFRLFKEMITNIIKHSEATYVTIEVSFKVEIFSIIVIDNGKGISDSDTEGYGTRNMNKRTEKLGGKLVITSKNCTNIRVDIPLLDNNGTGE